MLIEPFEESQLGLAHYRLHVGAIYSAASNGRDNRGLELICEGSAGALVVPANAYLLVESKEELTFPEGIFGRLTPVSSLIERGFGINAGKIDAGFRTLLGERQAPLVGVKNNLNKEGYWEFSSGLAHIEFVDLRGTDTRFGGFSSESLSSFEQRTERLVGTRRKDDQFN